MTSSSSSGSSFPEYANANSTYFSIILFEAREPSSAVASENLTAFEF